MPTGEPGEAGAAALPAPGRGTEVPHTGRLHVYHCYGRAWYADTGTGSFGCVGKEALLFENEEGFGDLVLLFRRFGLWVVCLCLMPGVGGRARRDDVLLVWVHGPRRAFRGRVASGFTTLA